MDDDTAALVEMLRTSRRPSIRLEAVRQLAAKRDPALAPILMEVLASAGDPRSIPVITATVAALQDQGESIAPAALAILDGPSDARRRFMPLLLASALKDRAIPRLLSALDDADLDVAANAAAQLGELRARQAFDPLLEKVRNIQTPSALRGTALAALGALRDPRALAILIEYLSNPDRDLVAGAIDGMADLRDPAGAEYLEALLERPDLDEDLQRAIRLGLLAIERYRYRDPAPN